MSALPGVLLLVLATSLGARLERVAKTRAPEHSLYLPSGKYLRWATLGNRSLAADLLYVWSIQYYSGARADRWRWLAQTYDVITDLDPRFLVAYSIGALILSVEAGRGDQALLLLDKGIANNPGRYLLPWEAAFYAREAGQAERMVRYFRLARECPDAPAYVARWEAYALEKSGRREEALALWTEAYETARSEYERQVAERYVNAIRLEIALDRLRGVIDAFREREGRWPRALEELIRSGWLRDLPLDPVGRPLLYDPVTGSIRAESGFLASHRVLR